ncbi:ER degradation-enhancing alpha-mannosidase-like protein 3 [Perkinsus olseni]|uniref:alpha-1,2-Mannosidase n=1 Tax=Perkinsus olseni TaxID=32597 RepID=A0A7J6MDL9_PEROL|nr:ER degradation-enhancing alpha-mannosidase-like protein 3 [Perkinsus olseni]KAF4669091.1 ER degradation-enhancing alpha-mannosidase-like protein 3 [Perkinsus olseni]
MLLGLDTPFKFALFIGYIVVWTSQSILVHLAAKRGIEYNYTTVVFLQDCCKMLITVFLFVRSEGSLGDLWRQMVVHKKLAVLYLVPAGLYAIYNNLTFISMATFDPATYYVLLQAKLVVTAILCVTVLHKPVSKVQWLGLFIITIGAMMKEYKVFIHGFEGGHSIWDYLLVLLLVLLSSFAGVYNEKLLKGQDTASPNVQNMFMYIVSMACNALGLMVRGSGWGLITAFSPENLKPILSWNVLAIIFNAAITGVMTGFFLKHLNSILKSIAAAIQVWTVAITSSIVFGYPIDLGVFLSLVLVTAGVWVYSRYPETPAPAAKPVPTREPGDEGDVELGALDTSSGSEYNKQQSGASSDEPSPKMSFSSLPWLAVFLLGTILVVGEPSMRWDGGSSGSGGMDLVERMHEHAFGGYMRYAFPYDELRPLSCDGRILRERGDLDFNIANVSMTYIDALDSLVLFDRLEDFGEAVDYISHNVTFDRDVVVSAFELNIRVLGGLLSGHLHAKRMGIPSGYQDGLLQKAIDLGDRLYRAFDTPTDLPAARVNLAGGVDDGEDVPDSTSVAEAGSWILEFGTLSLLTGDWKYYNAARKALDRLWGMRMGAAALLPTTISVSAGLWQDSLSSGAGPGHDSYYEYLLKAYVLFGDVELFERFMEHYEGISSYQAGGQLTFDIAFDSPVHSQVSPLQSFWGGVINSIRGPSAYATAVSRMWSRLWNSMRGLPEVVDIKGRGVNLIAYGRDFNLRPELAETLAQLGAATSGGVEDESYKWKLEAMAHDLENRTKVVCGYASIADVLGHRNDDRMDSFFLSETLPYLYMGVSGHSDVVASRFGSGSMGRVLTTEAHVLPLKGLTPLVQRGPDRAHRERSAAAPLICPKGPSPLLKLADMVDWHVSHGAWSVWPLLPAALRVAIPTEVTMPKGKARLVIRGDGMMGDRPLFNLSVGTAVFGGRIRERSGMEQTKWDLSRVKRTRFAAMIHSGPSLRAALKERRSCTLDGNIYRNATETAGHDSSYGLQWRESPAPLRPSGFRLVMAAEGSDFACSHPDQREYDEADNVMLVTRRGGNCSFADKALNAQLMGASGVLVIDEASSGGRKNLVMTCESGKNWLCRHIHIPAVSVPAGDFSPVLSVLQAGKRIFAELREGS